MGKKTKQAANEVKKLITTITLTYHELANPSLAQTLHKLGRADVAATSASRIHKIVKAVTMAMEEMKNEYIESIQKPFEEKLKVLGIEPGTGQQTKLQDEEKQKFLNEAHEWLSEQNEEFGKQEVEFDVIPLAPQHLAEVRISASDIEALGEFYDESGKVREAKFREQMAAVPSA